MDKSLIDKLLRRDSKSQKLIYDQHCDRLMHIIHRYVRSIHNAEEVLQDTFIQIFDKINLYDPSKGKFESWTHRIAVNLSLMRLRKEKSSRIKLADIQETQRIITNEALSKFEYEELISRIDNLDGKFSTLIKLRLIEGYEFREIAEMLDLNESYARKILSRARRQLVKSLNNSEDTLANHLL